MLLFLLQSYSTKSPVNKEYNHANIYMILSYLNILNISFTKFLYGNGLFSLHITTGKTCFLIENPGCCRDVKLFLNKSLKCPKFNSFIFHCPANSSTKSGLFLTYFSRAISYNSYGKSISINMICFCSSVKGDTDS